MDFGERLLWFRGKLGYKPVVRNEAQTTAIDDALPRVAELVDTRLDNLVAEFQEKNTAVIEAARSTLKLIHRANARNS